MIRPSERVVYEFVASWLSTGYILGYVYCIRLKNSSMKVHDLVCNALAGPLHVFTIYWHFKDHVVVKTATDKARVDPVVCVPPVPGKAEVKE